jgi:HAD superfamily hydrolase (TIGR01509 family)
MSVEGVIFDLDGTLVESRLNFESIRSSLGLPDGQPVLEAIAMIADAQHRAACESKLHEFECQAADNSVLMPGALELLDELNRRGLPQAILTRNSRICAERTVQHHKLQVSTIVTRDDGFSPKPAPDGILQICQTWNLEPCQVIMVGDFVFDIRAALAAGATAVLFAPETQPDWSAEADFVIHHLGECIGLLDGISD